MVTVVLMVMFMDIVVVMPLMAAIVFVMAVRLTTLSLSSTMLHQLVE